MYILAELSINPSYSHSLVIYILSQPVNAWYLQSNRTPYKESLNQEVYLYLSSFKLLLLND